MLLLLLLLLLLLIIPPRGLHSTALSVDSPAEREELDLIVPASVGEDKEVEGKEAAMETVDKN